MQKKYIGFPMKDGCHVNGADLGIDVIKEKINFDKIIDIESLEKDIDTVIHYDTILAKCVDEVLSNNNMPITIGGDHSLAIGSIAGSSKNNEIGVIWFDTHPDINTNKTTTTFNIHGYPLAASMGFGLDELVNLYDSKTKVNYENVVIFGINDIDDPEQELIDKYNIRTYTLEHINSVGIDYCIKDAIEYLNSKVKKIHLSFDIDSICKKDCPGVNVPNRWSKGLTKKDAFYALEEFLKELNVISMDIVEYNPITDKDDKALNIVFETIGLLEKIK